jgi:hypothetical protein
LGPTEEAFIAMYRLAQAMARLGEPWPDTRLTSIDDLRSAELREVIAGRQSPDQPLAE